MPTVRSTPTPAGGSRPRSSGMPRSSTPRSSGPAWSRGACLRVRGAGCRGPGGGGRRRQPVLLDRARRCRGHSRGTDAAVVRPARDRGQHGDPRRRGRVLRLHRATRYPARRGRPEPGPRPPPPARPPRGPRRDHRVSRADGLPQCPAHRPDRGQPGHPVHEPGDRQPVPGPDRLRRRARGLGGRRPVTPAAAGAPRRAHRHGARRRRHPARGAGGGHGLRGRQRHPGGFGGHGHVGVGARWPVDRDHVGAGLWPTTWRGCCPTPRS